MVAKKSLKKRKFLSKFFNSIKIDYHVSNRERSSLVTYLENARVANSGVVLKDFKIIKNSTIYDRGRNPYNNLGFLIKYLLPNIPFAKKNITYLKITDEWSDKYYHWIFEALSNLIYLRKLYPDAVIILPKYYLKNEYVLKSLEAFGIGLKNIITINRKSNLKVAKLAFTSRFKGDEENFSMKQYYDYIKYSEIRDRILTYFAKDLTLNYGEKIYISRNNPRHNFKRKIVNEIEVENFLAQRGFKKIYMEDHNFLEQVAIASHAKCIVAVHGAGICNAIFMKKGKSVFEIVGAQWERMFFADCFKEMLERVGMKHTSKTFPSDVNDDIIVDVKELEKHYSLSLCDKL